MTSAAGPSSRGRFLRRLSRAREGSTAVEFALVGVPFFLLTFAILEIGLIFVLSAVLDTAVLGAGRLIRTGQAESSNITAEKFKTELCSRMSVFAGDCVNRASVDVREVIQFQTPLVPDPTQTGSFDDTQLTYQIGQPGSLMLVRVWYRQPIVTPLMAQTLSRMNDGTALLVSTTSFKNEPYR
jgi:Flp pilus assembly protein TadG